MGWACRKSGIAVAHGRPIDWRCDMRRIALCCAAR